MSVSSVATVLVVEDEPGLRFLASEVLSNDGGFTVIEAGSADKALEVLGANHEISCVFTDVRMPGSLDGIALTRFIQQTYPDIPVLVTSGNLRPEERLADVPFVTKPYDLGQLAVVIQSLITEMKNRPRDRHG